MCQKCIPLHRVRSGFGAAAAQLGQLGQADDPEYLGPPERDAGRKVVMGKVFPAGQSTTKDLDDAIAMLMAHPNIAPFVSLRLIQHLVKSDPSPAYVARVGAQFRNNGQGGAGDLKAVAKAVLLDPEARRGDNPNGAAPADGKFREPFLHNMALRRGLNCTICRVPIGAVLASRARNSLSGNPACSAFTRPPTGRPAATCCLVLPGLRPRTEHWPDHERHHHHATTIPLARTFTPLPGFCYPALASQPYFKLGLRL